MSAPPGQGTGDQRILRALLAAVDDQTQLLDRGEPELLLAMARHHRLSPLLGASKRPGFPVALAAGFQRDYLATLGRNTVLKHGLEECLSALAGRDIDCIVLKGLVYETTLYGRPGTRPTTDLDLMVPASTRRKAFGVLTALGFRPMAAAPGFDEADYHEVEFKRDDLYVDLHFALAPLARGAIDYRKVWQDRRRLSAQAHGWMVLSPPHAAAYHALHMAIHHFDVPALYLLDFSRMVPGAAEAAAGEEAAREWRCHRAWTTTVGLTAGWIAGWREKVQAAPPTLSAAAARIVGDYATSRSVSRPEQLRRKFEHFDGPRDAVRYAAVQGRRIVREAVERRLRSRSAEERLGLPPPSRRP
jgi:hypothetical protein